MQNNTTLPVEVLDQINEEAAYYADIQYGDKNKFPANDPQHVRWGNSNEDYSAGATAWAEWKVKYDLLQRENILLRNKLKWVATCLEAELDTQEIIDFITKALAREGGESNG